MAGPGEREVQRGVKAPAKMFPLQPLFLAIALVHLYHPSKRRSLPPVPRNAVPLLESQIRERLRRELEVELAVRVPAKQPKLLAEAEAGLAGTLRPPPWVLPG